MKLKEKFNILMEHIKLKQLSKSNPFKNTKCKEFLTQKVLGNLKTK